MSEQCNGMECSTTTSCECGPSGQECPCGGDGCPCCSPNMNPVDFASAMWHKAAFSAMMQLKQEKVKAKLETAFGDALDRGADAVVEAMGKKFTSMIQSAQTEQDFRNKMASILNDVTKKA